MILAIFPLLTLFSAVQSCLVLQNAATSPPYASCACPIDVIKNNAHGNQLLSYNNNYYYNTTKYEISEPQVEADSQCRLTFSCQSPTSFVVLIGENEFYNTNTGKNPNNFLTICNEATKRWDLHHRALSHSLFNSPFLYMACVNFNAPLPTSKPPTCDCPSQLITNSTEPDYRLNNFYVRGEVSEDRCYWQMSCSNSRLAQARVNGQLYKSHFFAGMCNGGTQKWIVASGDGILWQDVPIFEYSCVELL